MQLLIVIGNCEKKKKKEETILTESKFPVRMASALFNYAHVNILSICIQFCTSLECMMYQSSLLVTKLNEQKSEYLFYMIKGSTVHYKTEQIR